MENCHVRIIFDRNDLYKTLYLCNIKEICTYPNTRVKIFDEQWQWSGWAVRSRLVCIKILHKQRSSRSWYFIYMQHIAFHTAKFPTWLMSVRYKPAIKRPFFARATKLDCRALSKNAKLLLNLNSMPRFTT